MKLTKYGNGGGGKLQILDWRDVASRIDDCMNELSELGFIETTFHDLFIFNMPIVTNKADESNIFGECAAKTFNYSFHEIFERKKIGIETFPLNSHVISIAIDRIFQAIKIDT